MIDSHAESPGNFVSGECLAFTRLSPGRANCRQPFG